MSGRRVHVYLSRVRASVLDLVSSVRELDGGWNSRTLDLQPMLGHGLENDVFNSALMKCGLRERSSAHSVSQVIREQCVLRTDTWRS